MRFSATVFPAAARAARTSVQHRCSSGYRRWFATTKASRERYGFIGLGNMGLPMAKNLCSKLTAADSVRVFDVNPSAGLQLLQDILDAQVPPQATIETAGSASEAAQDSDVVITVLPAAKHVQAVLSSILTPELSQNPGRLFIDCSTVDPVESQAIAKSIPASHGTFVDAPMSGGVRGASLGTLTFMLGSPDALAGTVSQKLQHMGSRVLHCGPNGAGLVAKLANNYVLAMHNIAVAEAMDLGVRLGVDPKVLASVINVSTGRCWSSEVNNPVPGVVDSAPASRDYEGGFAAALMAKDLGLVQNAKEAAGASMPFLERVREMYADLEKKGWGRKDFSVVYRHLGGVENKGR